MATMLRYKLLCYCRNFSAAHFEIVKHSTRAGLILSFQNHKKHNILPHLLIQLSDLWNSQWQLSGLIRCPSMWMRSHTDCRTWISRHGWLKQWQLYWLIEIQTIFWWSSSIINIEFISVHMILDARKVQEDIGKKNDGQLHVLGSF